MVRVSIYAPTLERFFARQQEARLGLRIVQDLTREVFSHRRTVLESMSGAASREPNVAQRRVPVDQEVAVPGVFVLADSRLNNWSMCKVGESVCDESPDLFHLSRGHHARLRVRIDLLSVLVQRNFQ